MGIEIEIDGLMSDELADTVVYNDESGPVEVQAIIDLGSIDGALPGRQAYVIVRKTEVPAPKYRQTFDINGETWTIAPEKVKDFVLYQSSGLWSLRVERDIRSTVCQR